MWKEDRDTKIRREGYGWLLKDLIDKLQWSIKAKS